MSGCVDLCGVDTGGAVRFLVGGSDDAPPLDLREESDLAALLDEHGGGLDEAGWLRLGVALLMAFVQHEITGPAVAAALVAVEPAVTERVSSELGVVGTAASHLLWLSRRALERSGESEQSALWRARLLGRMREASSEHRRDAWEEEMRTWAQVSGHEQEKALALGGQDRWAEALRLVTAAKDAAGLKAVLTGKMGKRTKYQTFECAQLVLEVEVEDREAEEEDRGGDEVEEVGLGADSILLEPVRGDGGAAMLSGQQQSLLVVEALCVARRHARDEMTLGLALPYVVLVLSQASSPYAVRTAALFVRSLLEAHLSKTRDRAALQLEALGDGWGRGQEDAATRLALLWGCPVPPRRALLLETARAYMRIGAVSTAAVMFRQLGRTRDEMSCLVVEGKPHAAAQLCLDMLVSAVGPQRWELLCLLGELQEKPELYEQAWQESGHKCAVAMRMAGRRHQSMGRHQEAQEAFKLALALAPSFPETQFCCGCCLLALGRAAEAAPCFAAAVHGMPDDGQAWANLSVALRAAGHVEQALVAGQQAARHSNRDWRVQHNLLSLALLAEPPREQLAVETARLLIELARDSAPSTERLPFEALERLAGSSARHVPALMDEACAAWLNEPAVYAFRAAMHEARGELRSAALDAGRAARLLRSRLQQDPQDKGRLERVGKAMLRQAELLERVEDKEAEEEKSSLRAGMNQLQAVYGDELANVFCKYLGE